MKLFSRLWRCRSKPDPYLEAQLSEALGRRWEIEAEAETAPSQQDTAARDYSSRVALTVTTAALMGFALGLILGIWL